MPPFLEKPFEAELAIGDVYAWKVLDKAQNENTFVSLHGFIWSGKVMESLCGGNNHFMPMPSWAIPDMMQVFCEPGQPNINCGCGIYCCKEEDHPEIMSRVNQRRDGPPVFIVKLQLFGRVIECSTGYRAGRAKIVAIRIVYFAEEPPLELAAGFEAKFGVPVTMIHYRTSIYTGDRFGGLAVFTPTPRQTAAPMFLADYVKLFHSTDNGRKIPQDIQFTFIREYSKKLTKKIGIRWRLSRKQAWK